MQGYWSASLRATSSRAAAARTPSRWPCAAAPFENSLTPFASQREIGMKVSLRVLALFALVFIVVGNAKLGDAAEATTGTIVGTVVDANGEGIPGASVTAASTSRS